MENMYLLDRNQAELKKKTSPVHRMAKLAPVTLCTRAPKSTSKWCIYMYAKAELKHLG